MAYCLRRSDTRSDAEDAVSETFLVVWRRLDEIPEGPARIPWVFGVARRVLANQYRSRDRRARLEERLTPPSEASPSEFEAVHGALERLRPDDREILTLSAWDDLDNDQIAVVLATTPANVAVRLHRARRRLARQLARLGAGAEEVKSQDPSRTPDGVRGVDMQEERRR